MLKLSRCQAYFKKQNQKKKNEMGYLERDENLEQQNWVKSQITLIKGSPIVQLCRQLPSLSLNSLVPHTHPELEVLRALPWEFCNKPWSLVTL